LGTLDFEAYSESRQSVNMKGMVAVVIDEMASDNGGWCSEDRLVVVVA
jgi:hypothetical protein